MDPKPKIRVIFSEVKTTEEGIFVDTTLKTSHLNFKGAWDHAK
jgi:hypothetical protein